MIAMRKDTGAVFMIAKFSEDNKIYVSHPNSDIGGYFDEDELNIYYSPEELQERIEAAVKEHEHRIGKVEEANNEVLGDNYELERELRESKKRIAELEAERQPVEISAEEEAAIDWYKRKYDAWELAVLECEDWLSSPHKKTIAAWTYGWCLQIVKRGYTVKPDPLRSTISAIWQEYEDGHISQTEALDKITEVAKAHSRTKEMEESK